MAILIATKKNYQTEKGTASDLFTPADKLNGKKAKAEKPDFFKKGERTYTLNKKFFEGQNEDTGWTIAFDDETKSLYLLKSLEMGTTDIMFKGIAPSDTVKSIAVDEAVKTSGLETSAMYLHLQPTTEDFSGYAVYLVTNSKEAPVVSAVAFDEDSTVEAPQAEVIGEAIVELEVSAQEEVDSFVAPIEEIISESTSEEFADVNDLL